MSNIHSSCLETRYPEPGLLTITRTQPKVKKCYLSCPGDNNVYSGIDEDDENSAEDEGLLWE